MSTSPRILLATFSLVAALSVRTAAAVSASRAPYSRIDPGSKESVTFDPQAIWLENDQLKLAIITCPPHAGQVFRLLYKPMNLELGNELSPQGFFWGRNAGIPGGAFHRITSASGEIVTQSVDQVQARVTYMQSGEVDGQKIEITNTKLYTLKKGAAFVLANWTVSGFSLPKRAHFRCSTGLVGWRGKGGLLHALPQFASFASEAWRTAGCRYIDAVIDYVEKHPQGRCVIGYMINTGCTGEAILWGFQEGMVGDFSQSTAPPPRGTARWRACSMRR